MRYDTSGYLGVHSAQRKHLCKVPEIVALLVCKMGTSWRSVLSDGSEKTGEVLHEVREVVGDQICQVFSRIFSITFL